MGRVVSWIAGAIFPSDIGSIRVVHMTPFQGSYMFSNSLPWDKPHGY